MLKYLEFKRFLGLSLVLLLTGASAAQALEPDQYAVWRNLGHTPLNDSLEPANRNLNAEFQTYLDEKINTHKRFPKDCSEIAGGFLSHIRPNFFKDRLKEDLIKFDQVQLLPQKKHLISDYKNSIHRGFAWPFIMPVAQTIKMNGVYFGTDKIDHFFSSGKRYYKRFALHYKKTHDYEGSIRRAIRFGVTKWEEGGVLGKWSSGAFSFADLEANYKGMMFAVDMCHGNTPALKFDETSRQWRLTHKLDLGTYVDPLWDEAYNNSHYAMYRFKRVREVIRQEYCPLGLSDKVGKLWKDYDKKTKANFNTQTISQLIKEKKVPNPKEQSLHNICHYPRGIMEGVSFWK